MQRRHLLAGAALGLAAAALRPARAQGTEAEEMLVPGGDPGIELYLRAKHPAAGPPRSAARTVLFLHGADGPGSTLFDVSLAGQSWMDYVAASGFEAWCLDLRGYGRSTRPAEFGQPPEASPPLVRGEVALRDVAAAIAHIRQARGIERIVLGGWGWGAALAARVAADNPTLVERLVLVAPPWIAAGQAGAGQLPAYRTLTRAAVRQGFVAGAPEAERGGLFPPGWFEHWADATFATDPEGARRVPSVLRVPNGAAADARESWQAGRPWFDPARITCPTLVTVAEWDQVSPPAQALGLFQALGAAPGKRLVVLDRGTHAIMLQRNRGALYQAVQGFLLEGAG
jgi:pimeloyl-ACP methyl ester carboxylesterase